MVATHFTLLMWSVYGKNDEGTHHRIACGNKIYRAKEHN